MIFARLEEGWYVSLSSYENHVFSIEGAVQSKDKFGRGNIRGYRLWAQKARKLVNVYRIQNGERIDPCSTPVSGEKLVDVALLSSTFIWTSSNKFRSRLTSATGAVFSSVCHIWRRSTVSYADLMSKNASTGVIR